MLNNKSDNILIDKDLNILIFTKKEEVSLAYKIIRIFLLA